MDVMGRLMRNILDDTGLRKDKGGKVRTLYSLRHSALMFRFQYGDKIDIYLLAKNALDIRGDAGETLSLPRRKPNERSTSFSRGSTEKPYISCPTLAAEVLLVEKPDEI